jgi:hypothetical protein
MCNSEYYSLGGWDEVIKDGWIIGTWSRVDRSDECWCSTAKWGQNNLLYVLQITKR